MVCGATETIVIKYSEPHDVESNMNYVVEVKGQPNIDFDVKVTHAKFKKIGQNLAVFYSSWKPVLRT